MSKYYKMSISLDVYTFFFVVNIQFTGTYHSFIRINCYKAKKPISLFGENHIDDAW